MNEEVRKLMENLDLRFFFPPEHPNPNFLVIVSIKQRNGHFSAYPSTSQHVSAVLPTQPVDLLFPSDFPNIRDPQNSGRKRVSCGRKNHAGQSRLRSAFCVFAFSDMWRCTVTDFVCRRSPFTFVLHATTYVEYYLSFLAFQCCNVELLTSDISPELEWKSRKRMEWGG